MKKCVHSGYYNIYRPPYSLSNSAHRSSIYCLSDIYNTVLVLIPLVPSFYKDVIDIVKNHIARKIYIVAPDIGVAFSSDYYLSWDTISNTYRKSCKIFSKYMIENYCRDDFKADIIRCENDNISISVPRSEKDVGTIDITFTKEYVNSAAPFSCDIILNDTHKKRLFVGEMNETKADFLNKNKNLYDEIHMPFIIGNYDGMSYYDLIKKYPALVNKVYCNQFASSEELAFAKSKGIKIGGVYSNDSI
jgi:hypothetical protein